MSSYNEEELKGMTRVELRRAAIAVLGIDNKECSNTKSQDLIDRILEEQGGGGGKSGGKASKASTKKGGTTKARSTGGRGRGKAKAKEDEGGGGSAIPELSEVIDRIDAVGKTVDENHTEVKELLDVIYDQQAEIQRQQFMIFGLMTDLYKFTGEPDELEERMTELDAEWEAQGNEDGGE